MATPEEQKAKLQAARLRAQSTSPARFEMGRKHFGITDPERSDELLHTASTRKAGAKDLFDVGELETKRKAALFSSRVMSAVGQKWQGEAARQAAQEEDPRFGGSQEGQDPAVRLRQGRLLAFVERTMQQRVAAQQDAQQQEEAGTRREADTQREEVKKKAKAAFRRGLMVVLNVLVGALNISSAGVAFLIDGFIHLFSLGWLNLEMIYGTYFAKGKSRFISPLSWDPIPMPIDKKGILLVGFVVTADIALALAFLVMSFTGYCLIHDFVIFTASPIQTGTALAQGGGELCLGGIISATFGP